MTIEDELAALRTEVRYLKDRQDVLDCVMNQSRGHDRHDLELMTSVYFDDAIDEHGPVVKSGPEYGEYANEAHSSIFIDHLHNITTHTCDDRRRRRPRRELRDRHDARPRPSHRRTDRRPVPRPARTS